MLTWAVAWMSVRMGGYIPLMFIISTGGDVAIAYFLASAIAGKLL